MTVLDQLEKRNFRQTIGQENLTRLISVALIYMFYEGNIYLNNRMYSNYSLEGIPSWCMPCLHIIYISIAILMQRNKKRISGLLIELIVGSYVWVLNDWAVHISIETLMDTGAYTMLILTMAVSSVLFYRRIWVIFLTNIVMYLLFAYRVIRTGAYANLFEVLVVTLICCAFGFIVNRLRWNLFLEQKAVEETALKDSLTNIYNHKTIINLLEMELRGSHSKENALCVMMADIDHFKRINDIYGHQVGDAVIMKVAQIIENSCREEDYVGRYGGEEFLVVLSDTDKEGGTKFAERIRETISRTDFGLEDFVTISIGLGTGKSENAVDMVRQADEAMYCAKKNGRNRVVVS